MHEPQPEPLQGNSLFSNWSLVLISFVVIGAIGWAAIYAFATFGGSWVDGLDNQIGELVARRAQNAHAAGDDAEAIALYRQSLRLHFDDPAQRFWAHRALAELLVQREAYAEAIAVLEDALPLRLNDAKANVLLCLAYMEASQPERAAEFAGNWAQRSEDPTARALAYFQQGQALEVLARPQEALSAYLAGAEADPTSHNAYHAAVLLSEEAPARARALLQPYLAHATGWRKEWAHTLFSRLENAA